MKQKFFNAALVLVMLVLSFCLSNQVMAQSTAPSKTSIIPGGDAYNLGTNKTVSQTHADEMKNGKSTDQNVSSTDQLNNSTVKTVQTPKPNFAKPVSSNNTSTQQPIGVSRSLTGAGTDPNVLRQFMTPGKGTCTTENFNKFSVAVNAWLKQDANNIQKLNQKEVSFINADDYKGLYTYLYSNPAGK